MIYSLGCPLYVTALSRQEITEGKTAPSLILTIDGQFEVYLTGPLAGKFEKRFIKKGVIKFRYFGYVIEKFEKWRDGGHIRYSVTVEGCKSF